MTQNILITGAASGIGYAISKYFNKKGFKVIGLDVKKADDETLFEEFFQCDVSSSSQLLAVLESLKSKGMNLVSIVNNAAVQVEKSLLDTSEEEWDQVLNVNLKSLFLTTKTFMSLFDQSDSNSITNISSVHSSATSKGLASYVASKGGVTALTKAMALELADKGIRVNSVHPGAIDTPMLRKGLSRNDEAGAAFEKLKKSSPLEKVGTGEEVAGLVYFLTAGDGCLNITGQDFYTDSGVLAKLASE